MKRYRIDLPDIASYQNLSYAAMKAAKGKRVRCEIKEFYENFDKNINILRENILSGRSPLNNYKNFYIHDPKKRKIHAACFEDRILHHAIMNKAGPVLDRALVPETYACRVNKGAYAAVKNVQKNTCHYPWFVKIDIKHYFDNIDHGLLINILERKFKGRLFLNLLTKVVDGYSKTPGKGLPIGSLTSQYFANFYLDAVDRYVLEQLPVLAYIRYMDDMVWWCKDKATAKVTLQQVKCQVEDKRKLIIKAATQINQSTKGIGFCGYRIFPNGLRLSRRRCKAYQQRRRAWEWAYKKGVINERQLQTAYDGVHALTIHANSLAWRKQNLERHPPIVI